MPGETSRARAVRTAAHGTRHSCSEARPPCVLPANPQCRGCNIILTLILEMRELTLREGKRLAPNLTAGNQGLVGSQALNHNAASLQKGSPSPPSSYPWLGSSLLESSTSLASRHSSKNMWGN